MTLQSFWYQFANLPVCEFTSLLSDLNLPVCEFTSFIVEFTSLRCEFTSFNTFFPNLPVCEFTSFRIYQFHAKMTFCVDPIYQSHKNCGENFTSPVNLTGKFVTRNRQTGKFNERKSDTIDKSVARCACLKRIHTT